MNRFSFRVWNGKEYLKGPDLDNLVIGISGEGVLLVGNNEIVYPDENYIIQQFTSLKDKNGKDIYEGDIVRFSHEDNSKNLEVSFSEGYFGLNRKTEKLALLAAYFHKCEVIGNIFENSELLK